jgi:NADP-dependent aldehyde dehydrogenase
VAERIGEAEPGALLNPDIQRAYESGVRALAARTGAAVVGGGTELPDTGTWVTPHAAVVSMAAFLAEPSAYTEECFGPAVLLVEYADPADLLRAVDVLPGCLAAAIHASAETGDAHGLCERLIERLQDKAGRLVWNGWPTGVAVTWSMQHGGPYPASTNAATTSVGAAAIARFLRPVVVQGFPERFLPRHLRDDTLTGVIRRNGVPEIRRPGEPRGA